MEVVTTHIAKDPGIPELQKLQGEQYPASEVSCQLCTLLGTKTFLFFLSRFFGWFNN